MKKVVAILKVFFIGKTENYAGSIICKQGEKNFYPSLFFWSRTKTLSDEATAVLNGFMTKYSLGAFDLADVNQKDCNVAA